MRVFHRGLNDWFVELDQDMLATNSKRQKWKSAAIRAECRHSYKYGPQPIIYMFMPDRLYFYRRAMMEKEDEGAGEEDTEDDEVDAKGEHGGPVDTVMAQAQESVSQPTQQEDERCDVSMEDAEILSDVTDLSSSPVLL